MGTSLRLCIAGMVELPITLAGFFDDLDPGWEFLKCIPTFSVQERRTEPRPMTNHRQR